jgi:hypothetical protein
MNAPTNNVGSDSAYRPLKQSIDSTYPPGWFVAIAENQVVAVSPDFHELEAKLRAQGKDPRNVLVVEAGVDFPEYVTVFI